MNSNRSSYAFGLSTIQKETKPSNMSQQKLIQNVKSKIHKKLAIKYCTCQNYMIINQINRTILGKYSNDKLDKQCILKTTLNDLKFNRDDQERIQKNYTKQKADKQLSDLIQYYKYYSQKSVLFIKQYFPLLYQYQQKKKVIEYNRLKILLNLSDSGNQQQTIKKINPNQDEISKYGNFKSRIGISRNYGQGQKDFTKVKGYKGINILDQLSQTQILGKEDQNEQSLLINRLRNNLSKHMGPSNGKNMSIEQIDRLFNFPNKSDNVKHLKQKNNFFLLPNGKQKINAIKSTKFSRQQTHTNTPDELKNLKTSHIRKRSAKRNNSCQNLYQVSAAKNPYQMVKNPYQMITTSKLRRKKNLSMDNIHTHTSTPYMPEQKRQSTKIKRITIKEKDRQYANGVKNLCISTNNSTKQIKQLKQVKQNKQKQNRPFTISNDPDTFFSSISQLKNRIKKQKQILMKGNYINNNNLTAGTTKDFSKRNDKVDKIQKLFHSSNNTPHGNINQTACRHNTINSNSQSSLLYNSMNTANQRFSKKNYEKLRQKQKIGYNNLIA